MKKLTLILLIFCVFTTKAQNLILNGSFEQNSATISCQNMNGLNLPDIYIYYGPVVPLINDSCLLSCSTSSDYWGGGQ